MSNTPAGGRRRHGVSKPESASTGGSFSSFLHRNRILEAAARVFAKQGVRQVSVEELLQASSVSRRTFYRFFRNKEDVLAALHSVATQYFVDRMRQAMASTPDPATKLERLVDAYLSFSQTDAALLQLMRTEAQRPDSPLAPARSRIIEAMAALLADEVQSEPGRRADPFLIIGLLVGAEGVSMQLHALGAVTPARLERARRVMLRILLAGLAPEGAQVPPLPLEPAQPRATKDGSPRTKARRGAKGARSAK